MTKINKDIFCRNLGLINLWKVSEKIFSYQTFLSMCVLMLPGFVAVSFWKVLQLHRYAKHGVVCAVKVRWPMSTYSWPPRSFLHLELTIMAVGLRSEHCCCISDWNSIKIKCDEHVRISSTCQVHSFSLLQKVYEILSKACDNFYLVYYNIPSTEINSN